MNASIKDDIKRKLDLINCNDIEKIKNKEVVDDIEQMLGIATAGGGSFSRTGSFDYRAVPEDEDDIANRISDKLTGLELTNPLTPARCKQLICEIKELLDW